MRGLGRHTGIAQCRLGDAYQRGLGTPKDPAEAIRLYKLAVDQGICPAMVNLGKMYEQGDGVAPDSVEAVRLYRMAAVRNDRLGQGNLGDAYQ